VNPTLVLQFDVRRGGNRRGNRTDRTFAAISYIRNAVALAEIGKLANRPDVVQTYSRKPGSGSPVQEKLWDPDAKFFKVRLVNWSTEFRCATRASIGFIPGYLLLTRTRAMSRRGPPHDPGFGLFGMPPRSRGIQVPVSKTPHLRVEQPGLALRNI
jgi:hypothetical protein